MTQDGEHQYHTKQLSVHLAFSKRSWGMRKIWGATKMLLRFGWGGRAGGRKKNSREFDELCKGHFRGYIVSVSYRILIYYI